ncbi:bifunctional UDP-N-acetylglucosamine diphosphorylase/glucosamine-1-phosphate N-acetyltransferase GlmU [Gammaproteobacteria bacterium]|nr:bifunctional UDP-N-acetylglucosamine diphosphorylase/glucosamine-1-phosphate N-acetyltransferase GlmU [Gammaproteobacteria bacterium]
MSLSIIILAAGQGKRMKSKIQKVLHSLAGKSLLEHVVNTTNQFETTQPPIIVYGHQGEIIRQKLTNLNATWVEQTKQLGTGHAVLQAMPQINDSDHVLILYGDVPLINFDTLTKLIKKTSKNAIGIITAKLQDPKNLGRIVRDASKQIKYIVEEKDASPAELAIKEINSGIYIIPAKYLKRWLPKLSNNNAQKEYYLTDIIKIASEEKIPIHSEHPEHIEEVFGINDKIQLAHAERFFQKFNAEKLMRNGVTFLDPQRIDIRGELIAGQDVVIDINVIIEGRVVIGDNCIIGANSILKNVVLSNNVEIKANCFIEESHISENCLIGPFARIRPGTILSKNVQIGNFIEIKNSKIGVASKIHHVGYIGDTKVGDSVNIGAGVITCNYNGYEKNKTIIGNKAFIGSNSELVAPVTIGEMAVIGAGSTIRRDAPANKLTVSGNKQRTIENRVKKLNNQEEA